MNWGTSIKAGLQSRHVIRCIEGVETGMGLICGGLPIFWGWVVSERGGRMEGGWVLCLLSYGDGIGYDWRGKEMD